MVKKKCCSCKCLKNPDEFSGKNSECKPCAVVRVREWRIKTGRFKFAKEKINLRIDEDGNQFKTCTKCHKEKPIEDYTFLKALGRRIAPCRQCETDRKGTWNKKPVNRKKHADRARKYYQENREMMQAKIRRYRARPGVQENRNRLGREYHQKNLQKMRALRRAYSSKFRAVKNGLEILWDEKIAAKTLDHWDNKCCYCAKDVTDDLHFDHFIPLSAEDCPGTVPWNVVPACQKCNNRKYNKDPYRWKGARGYGILSRIELYLDEMRNIYATNTHPKRKSKTKRQGLQR